MVMVPLPTDFERIKSSLSSARGRDFETAVAEGFRGVGLGADHIEETQGESDVLVFATHCEEPFGVVVECEAKEGPGQVGAEKVGQVRSHFSRYLSRFGYASKVFRCVVGRPSFSKDCVKDAKGTSDKETADVGVCLVSAHDLATLVELSLVVPISQEDLRDIFSRDGEVSANVRALETKQKQLLATYGAVLATLDVETRESGKTVVRLDRQNLIGQTATLLRVRRFGRVPDTVISRAISDLSSPLLDLLRVDEVTVRRTSHKIPERLAVLGKAGERISQEHDQMLRFLQKP